MQVKTTNLSLAYRRGWQSAMEAFDEALDEMPEHLLLTPKDEPLLRAVHTLCGHFMLDEEVLKRKPTNRGLARKYCVSLRTIANWKKAEAPLDGNQWQMLDWISSNRSLPPRTKLKFARQFERRRNPFTQAKTLLRAVRAASLS